jgi:hypothetical protein
VLGPWAQIEKGRAILVWFTGKKRDTSQEHVLEITRGQSVTFLKGVRLHWYIIEPVKKYYRMLHSNDLPHYTIKCDDCSRQCGIDYYVIPGPSRPELEELGEVCPICYQKYHYGGRQNQGRVWPHWKRGVKVQDLKVNTEKGAASTAKAKAENSDENGPCDQDPNTGKGAAQKMKAATGKSGGKALCGWCLDKLSTRKIPRVKRSACSRCYSTTNGCYSSSGNSTPHWICANLHVPEGLPSSIQKVLAKKFGCEKEEKKREGGSLKSVVKLDGNCEEWKLGDRDSVTGGLPDREWGNRSKAVTDNEARLGASVLKQLDEFCLGQRQRIEDMCNGVWAGPVPDDGKYFMHPVRSKKRKPVKTEPAATSETGTATRKTRPVRSASNSRPKTSPRKTRPKPSHKPSTSSALPFVSQWHWGAFAIIHSKGEDMHGQQPHIDLADGQVSLHLAA